MKNILVAIACCLTLPAPIHAVDLALGSNAVTAGGSPAEVDRATAKMMHLELGSRPEEKGAFLEGAGGSTLAAPVQPAAPAPGANGASASDWISTGATQSLTLDARPKPHGLEALPGGLPMATTAGLGVSDSTVYAGLGLLVLALGWACSGWVNRPRTAGVPEERLERSSRRIQRVKMIPLNVDRKA